MNYELYVSHNANIHANEYFILFDNHYFAIYRSGEMKRIYGLMHYASDYGLSTKLQEKICKQLDYIIPVVVDKGGIDEIFPQYNSFLLVKFSDSNQIDEVINLLNESKIDFKFKTNPMKQAYFHIIDDDRDKIIFILTLCGVTIK